MVVSPRGMDMTWARASIVWNSAFSGDCHSKLSKLLNLDNYQVAICYGTNAGRSSCEKNVSWPECHHRTGISDEVGNVENKIACVSLLTQLTVHPTTQLKVVWISYFIGSDHVRTQWGEGVKGFASRAILCGAHRYIKPTCVPKDIVKRFAC